MYLRFSCGNSRISFVYWTLYKPQKGDPLSHEEEMSDWAPVNNIPPVSWPPDSVEALDLLTAKFVDDSKSLQSQYFKLLTAIVVTAFLLENYERMKFTAVTEKLRFFQRETCDNEYAKFITENVNYVCKNVKSVNKSEYTINNLL